ncbi:MAG: 2-hydroxyacyl-CoA dehydratase family protein [Pseudomonadota bacterium]
MGVLEQFAGLAASHTNSSIESWKKQGGKVVGYLCSHVPVEILHAAGILPVRLRAPGCTSTTMADSYLSHLNCTYVRSCLELILTGEYNFLDGIVFTNGCDHGRRLYDVIREAHERPNLPFMHFFCVPRTTKSEAIAKWFSGEIENFRQSVEQAFDVSIPAIALKNAISVCNDTRGHLRYLYELRKLKAPPITGAEALAVIVAAGSIPGDRYNHMLQDLFHELEEREGAPGHGARLLVAGSGGCDNPEYFRIIEEQGGLIVTDSLCYGTRFFHKPVEAGEGDDPIDALAGAYLQRPSCAGMVDRVAERSDYVVSLAREYDAHGVVYQYIRYCDLWGGQLLHLRKRLKQENIPLLVLEREYALGAVEQLKTRVQAFIECL